MNKKIVAVLIAFLLCLVSYFVFFSKSNFNGVKENNKRKEIESNDTMEYAQFIDSNIFIEGSLKNLEDIDYYKISPTNGFIMDFNFKTLKKYSVQVELLNFAGKSLIYINSRDIKNYNGNIFISNFLMMNDYYYIKLQTDKDYGIIKYDMDINIKSGYPFFYESEPNDNFENANNILSFEKPVEGAFLKKSLEEDKRLKDYIDFENVSDIDVYKIENATDIQSDIEVVMNYAYLKDTVMLIFDKDYNLIKSSTGVADLDFKPKDKYYIVVYLKGNNSILSHYTIKYRLK